MRYSIPADGDGLVVNGGTIPFPTTTPPTALGTGGAIGGMIMSGFGDGPGSAGEFTGGSSVVRSGRWIAGLVVVVGVALVVCL